MFTTGHPSENVLTFYFTALNIKWLYIKKYRSHNKNNNIKIPTKKINRRSLTSQNNILS